MDIVWVILGSFFNVVLGVIVGATIVLKLEEHRDAWRKDRKNQATAYAVRRLEQLTTEYKHDPAEMHTRADGVVCGLLMQEGYVDVMDAYEKILELR